MQMSTGGLGAVALLGVLLGALTVSSCGTAQGAPALPHMLKLKAGRPRSGKRRPQGSSITHQQALPPVLPPLPQPTVQRPLTILVIGDSLAEDLGMGLHDIIGAQLDIRLYPEAVGSTGLVDTAYYNWPVALERELVRYHPELVVALFGGNDALSFDQAGRYVPFGSVLWREDYGGRVAAILRESRQAGARVVWVGLPMMAPSSDLSNRLIKDLNTVYAAEAAAHRGVTYLSTWSLFTNSQGQYAADLTDTAGHVEIVRDPDGVHIAPSAGTDLIASSVVAWIDASQGLRLCPRADSMWQAYLPKECVASGTAAR